MLRIIADENTRALNNVDPLKVKKNAQALRTLQETYMMILKIPFSYFPPLHLLVFR